MKEIIETSEGKFRILEREFGKKHAVVEDIHYTDELQISGILIMDMSEKKIVNSIGLFDTVEKAKKRFLEQARLYGWEI